MVVQAETVQSDLRVKKLKCSIDLKIFVKTLKTLLYTYREIENKTNILIYLIHYLVYCIWVYILFSTL